MLLHSHIPGQLTLLPALPTSMSNSGYIRGIHARGDIKVNIAWSKGVVIGVSLLLDTYNPWPFDALVQSTSFPGFLSVPGTNTSKGKGNNREGNVIDINSSNELYAHIAYMAGNVMDDSINKSALYTAYTAQASCFTSTIQSTKGNTSYIMSVTVLSFPCHVILCSRGFFPGDYNNEECFEHIL